ASLHQGIVHLKQALDLLVPKLFEHCHVIFIKSGDIKGLRQRNFNYIYPTEAMDYAQRYSWFAYHLTGYRLGWFNCNVEGRIITFPSTAEDNAWQSLTHHTLKRYHEARNRNKDAINDIYNESPPEKIIESLQSAVKHGRSEQLLHAIPAEVFHAMRKLVIAASPAATIEPDITFSGYTVQEYYDFWVSLSALLLAFLQGCRMKYSKSPKQFINSTVLMMQPSEIVHKICGLTNISASSCEKIVNELVLDVKVRRPDIQVHPMVPTNVKDFVLVSPSLIFTSNWEVCLLRNWAKPPDKYGELVAVKKTKLAEQLAVLVNQPTVKQSPNKKVFDSGGNVVTDVDLALFDSQNGYLALIQLKWLIEPDSLQEESNAREELLKGIAQLKKCISLFNSARGKFISRIFPQDNIDPEQVRNVQFMLICRGFSNFGSDAQQFDIDVLDYEITLDLLKKTSELPISDRFRQIVDLHSRIQKNTKERLCYNSMKIAGYLFRTPGLKAQDNKGITNVGVTRMPPGAKGPCSCGSGVQYRDCCGIIESLDEGDSSYNTLR
ncbi:MAG TPA: hypothetical protein VEG28_02550, partial [Dehalococcoidia bacterium]|nr:hypothetical protein [Dehalococcoidia bacterium]